MEPGFSSDRIDPISAAAHQATADKAGRVVTDPLRESQPGDRWWGKVRRDQKRPSGTERFQQKLKKNRG
jgi:hypothetical protein